MDKNKQEAQLLLW